MMTSFHNELSFKDYREQIKVLNYFDKFYAKSVNIFYSIYLSSRERRKLMSKTQSLPISVSGYFLRAFPFYFWVDEKKFSTG